jgi:N6-L-threonylcarbamoyladenine synthase
MLGDGTCDFSFAGLKTAVLYILKKYENISEEDQKRIALAFEDAVADVLYAKSAKAMEDTGAETFVIGGGVSANRHIRRTFIEQFDAEQAGVALRIPAADLTTDNAVMIALAGFYRASRGEFADLDTLRADGNRSLA